MSEMTLRFSTANSRNTEKGDLELSFEHGMPIVIPKRFHAALLAALLEDAGAIQVEVTDCGGHNEIFNVPHSFPDCDAWLLPIPEDTDQP